MDPSLAAFRECIGSELLRVLESEVHGCKAKVVFVFPNRALVVSVLAETDEVAVGSSPVAQVRTEEYSEVSATPPYRSQVGGVLRNGWVTVNHQGYTDGVLLSFRHPVSPSLALVVAASSLHSSEVLPA